MARIWKTGKKEKLPVVVGKKTFVQTKLILGANKEGSGLEIKPIKKPHRYKPGTVALREIRKQQQSVDNIIPKLPFRRLIKELIHDYNVNLRLTETAADALQEAAEDYLTTLFSDVQLMAIGGKRKGIQVKDMKIVAHMQNKSEV